MKRFVVQKLFYATATFEAETEEEALEEALCAPKSVWDISDMSASEDYEIVEEEIIETEKQIKPCDGNCKICEHRVVTSCLFSSGFTVNNCSWGLRENGFAIRFYSPI